MDHPKLDMNIFATLCTNAPKVVVTDICSFYGVEEMRPDSQARLSLMTSAGGIPGVPYPVTPLVMWNENYEDSNEI
jgi:hypothetical protein